MPLDPSEFSVRDLRDELKDVSDPDDVEAILEAEKAGEDRTTAKEAIEGRQGTIEAAHQESEPEEAEGDGDDGDDGDSDYDAYEDNPAASRVERA